MRSEFDMWKAVQLATGLLALAGCATDDHPSPQVSALSPAPPIGSATISGQAELTLRSGKHVRCDGDKARLIAVTPDTRDRMTQVFKTDGSGYASRISVENSLSDGQLGSRQRRASCDSQGRFRFEHVGAGQYYLLTKVYWSARWGWYGGGMVRMIQVGDAEQANVILSHALSGNE